MLCTGAALLAHHSEQHPRNPSTDYSHITALLLTPALHHAAVLSAPCLTISTVECIAPCSPHFPPTAAPYRCMLCAKPGCMSVRSACRRADGPLSLPFRLVLFPLRAPLRSTCSSVLLTLPPLPLTKQPAPLLCWPALGGCEAHACRTIPSRYFFFAILEKVHPLSTCTAACIAQYRRCIPHCVRHCCNLRS